MVIKTAEYLRSDSRQLDYWPLGGNACSMDCDATSSSQSCLWPLLCSSDYYTCWFCNHSQIW